MQIKPVFFATHGLAPTNVLVVMPAAPVNTMPLVRVWYSGDVALGGEVVSHDFQGTAPLKLAFLTSVKTAPLVRALVKLTWCKLA